MIIAESGAFRKGHHANLVSPFRDSATLSTLCQKLYTRRVEAFSKRAADETGEKQTPSGKFSDELALSFET
jgi:hypothetical protein